MKQEKFVKVFIGEYSKWEKKAKVYIKDSEKVKDLLDKSLKKATKNTNVLKNVWEHMLLSLSLLKDWVNGTYKIISHRSIIIIIIALIYYVTPFDIIPDFLQPFIGYIDDVSVISYLFKHIRKDLIEYKVWKMNEQKGKK